MKRGVKNFEQKREIAHKIHLIMELRYDGYDSVIKYRTAEELEYIESIKNSDLDSVKYNLTQELYKL